MIIKFSAVKLYHMYIYCVWKVKNLYNLDKEVDFWSDYLYARYHPKVKTDLIYLVDLDEQLTTLLLFIYHYYYYYLDYLSVPSFL